VFLGFQKVWGGPPDATISPRNISESHSPFPFVHYFIILYNFHCSLMYCLFGSLFSSFLQIFNISPHSLFVCLLVTVCWFYHIDSDYQFIHSSFFPFFIRSFMRSFIYLCIHYILIGGLEHVLFFHILYIYCEYSSKLTNSYFFRGVGIPPIRLFLTIMNHTITINVNHILIV
jgi:hypothetical protein